MFDNRLSTTGPGSPALASAMSLSVVSVHATSADFCSAESCVSFFGGISPLFTCSSTSCQIIGSFLISASVVKRSRSRSPFCLLVEWQLRQVFSRMGRMVFSKPKR